MTLTEWLEEIEGYGLRVERFIDDCDHHKKGSTGSNERMIQWLRAAYEAGYKEGQDWYVDDGK
jgi:hypothetical protein